MGITAEGNTNGPHAELVEARLLATQFPYPQLSNLKATMRVFQSPLASPPWRLL
jgi:hypothetical protein